MKEMPTLTLSGSVLDLMEKLTGVKPKATTTVSLEACVYAAKRSQPDKKAAYALLPAYLFERREKTVKIRKELLETGKVQAVISLPNRLLVNTNIPVSIIVIGKNETDKIMLVNASDIYTEEDQYSVILAEDNIQAISALCSEETAISRYVSLSEIAEHDYDLSPSMYIKRQ